MSEKKYGHTLEYDGPFMCDYVKHELTGICKKVTGGVGSSGKPVHYYQAQQRLFGIPLWKYWIETSKLYFFDPKEEVYCECEIYCGKVRQ